MILRTAQYLLNHPLSSRNKSKAFYRFFSWQIGSRLIGMPVAYDFVDQSRLLVHPGMTGATGNVYAGLHEFEDMAFVLHALRKNDFFVDIGANIGSYTVLAGAAVGADCVAIEPVPSTFGHLLDNVNLNNLGTRIECLNVGLGNEHTTLHFSAGEDSTNHVIAETEACNDSIEVEVRRLDDVLSGRIPAVIKMDVEGWESSVIDGAGDVLSRQEPMAILMEFGAGERYGFDDHNLYQRMLDFGFESVSYSPFKRKLTLSDQQTFASGNILFVKQLDYFRERVSSAPSYKALNISI